MKKSQAAKIETEAPRATYQDVLDVPPHMVAEVVAGTLYTHPRPASPHVFACFGLANFIGSPFHYGLGGPGGWWIAGEPELHLGEDIVVPDLAGWRHERMPEIPIVTYFTLVPDWVCEVLSPSTRKLDLDGKRAVYAREGVGYIWFVDPDARSLDAYALHGTEWVLIDSLFDDASVSLPPFEAINFNLGVLWLPQAVHKAVPRDESSKTTVESEPESISPSN